MEHLIIMTNNETIVTCTVMDASQSDANERSKTRNGIHLIGMRILRQVKLHFVLCENEMFTAQNDKNFCHCNEALGFKTPVQF